MSRRGCARCSRHPSFQSAGIDQGSGRGVRDPRKTWRREPRCREKLSPGFPSVATCTLFPDATERPARFCGGERLTGAEHPDAAFLLQGQDTPPGAQCHLVTLYRDVKGVASGQVEFVPEGLGQDDATCLVYGNFRLHNVIIDWFLPFGKWQFRNAFGQFGLIL